MRNFAALLVFLTACQDPPKAAQHETCVRGLIDLHKWDPSTEAQGQYGYDAVMSAGEEIFPSLVAHLTDETPTMLYDRMSDRTVKLGDVCFYMLLKLTGLKSEDFMTDGVIILTSLENRIFCIKWLNGMESRRKVQLHFQKILPPPEP